MSVVAPERVLFEADLLGRDCLYRVNHCRIVNPVIGVANGQPITTGTEPLPDATVLPRIGERVTINPNGAEHDQTGFYVGLSTDNHLGFVWLWDTGEVRAVEATLLDVRAVLATNADGPAVAVPLQALTTVGKLARDKQAKETWVEDLADDAIEWADENNLCHRFDDFMEEHGLRAREHDYYVRVTVNLTLDVTARTEDDASNAVTAEMISAAIATDGWNDYEIESVDFA